MPSDRAASTSSRKIVEYKHACAQCGRVFRRAAEVERHRRSAHTNDKPYGCEFCALSFARIDSLQRHVSLYHKRLTATKNKLDQESVDAYWKGAMAGVAVLPPSHPPQHPAPTPAIDLTTAAGHDLEQSLMSWISGASASPHNSSPSMESASTSTLLTSPSATSLGSLTTPPKEAFALPDVPQAPSLHGLPPSHTWSPLQQPHVNLYLQHFARHMPFISMATLDIRVEHVVDEYDDDLRRAMAIIGGNYIQSAGADTIKPCDFYSCGALKQRVLQSVEELQDGGSEASTHVLLRRTQTMVLLQLVAMFSESKRHRVGARLSHGSLIAIARELLQQRERNAASPSSSRTTWLEWVQREEIVRTVWAVYLVDSLQSFCEQRQRWLSLSELSELPDLGADRMWCARSEDEYRHHAAASSSAPPQQRLHEVVTSLREEEASPGLAPLASTISLTGNLVALVSIVSEVMTIVRADTAARKQLAVRLARTSGDQANDSRQAIAQALLARNTHLHQEVGAVTRQLNRWLSVLHLSARMMPDSDARPFAHDYMPWYWAGLHFLTILQERVGDVIAMEEQSTDTLNAQLTLFGDTVEDDASLEIMRLLVRIRSALNGADRGASMQCAVGSPRFADVLPPLPPSVALHSITGFFPALS